MNARWLEERVTYDGSQLQPHWIRRTTGIVGDALVAFRGPCAVPANQMVDLVDLLAGSAIAGADMLHFVWERFDSGDLVRAFLRQRLLAAQALETLRACAPAAELCRKGDDLFLADRKLSISVATRSLVSTLIHFAVNVSNEGTPVPTSALADLGVDPRVYAQRVLATVLAEEQSMAAARCQVRAREEG